MNERRPCIPADWIDFERMEEALTVVHGNFLAAAKLIDMEPQRFRNLLNGNALLKRRWGKKRRGRPIGPAQNFIRFYNEDEERFVHTPVGVEIGVLKSMNPAQ